MKNVICYPESCRPVVFEKDNIYVELLSNPKMRMPNLASTGVTLLAELKKYSVVPSPEIYDFCLIAFSVMAADKLILRAKVLMVGHDK